MKQKLIGIFGLGIFGTSIANTLAHYDCDVIAIDRDAANVEHVADHVSQAVVGDFTDLALLKELSLEDCDAVVIATGTSLEATILAIMNCRKLNIPNIIVKAKNTVAKEVIEAIGVSHIILPEKEAGIRVAKRLLRTNIQDVINLDEHTTILEFYPPDSWHNKKLHELNLRKRYDINLIGYRNRVGGRLHVALSADYQIQKNTLLVAIAESTVFEQHDFLNTLS